MKDMKKLLSTTIAVGILAVTSSAPAFALADNALPNIDSFQHGSVTNGQNNDLKVKVDGAEGTVGEFLWNSFNVGKNASVDFEFSAHNQTALNRVKETGGLSEIYGSITNSGCAGCNYAGTGKIILINPNGVLFGDGANVNVNSFTVSTFDGQYNKDSQELVLNRNGKVSGDKGGITIDKGAVLKGDKGVHLVSDKVNILKGSQISTSIVPNANNNTDALGKVKIVTSDGVTFQYHVSGAVDKVKDVKASSQKMVLNVNGNIDAGHIEIANYSTHADSEVNLNGANLKATKAVRGNDGNIWLTANNRVVIDDSQLTTVNGGNIDILAGNKVSVGSSTLNASGNLIANSQNGDLVVDGSNLTSAKDVKLTAKKIASVQKKERGNSTIKGDNITITGSDAWTNGATMTASKNLTLKAETGDVVSNSSTLKADKITLDAKGNVSGNADVTESNTNITAGKDINVKLKNVGNREHGLIAEADQSVTVETDGTLSISRLVAKNGDMNIKAKNVIAGKPYTNEEKVQNGDTSERSYIYVEHGKFNSQTSEDSYTISASDKPINGGKENLRHHIEYGNGEEKILLINPQPAPAVEPGPSADVTRPVVSVNDDQASMLNKLPRQPETIKVNNAIKNNKTQLVDVYAAASQIEIEDDEEE